MASLKEALGALTSRYCELHRRKEDLFWSTKMGLEADEARARRDAAEAEKEWNRFLQDPVRLRELRALAGVPGASPEERPDPQASHAAPARTLGGWIAMLEAHTIESAEGRKLSEEIVELEAALEQRRRAMELGFVDPATGLFEQASSVRLALLMRTDPDERRRRAAYQALTGIETFVLDAGFLEIVRKRNRLGRLLGFEDFYDWRVAMVERTRKRDLFAKLDELAARTEAGTRRALDAFAESHGAGALDPWTFSFLRAGDLTERTDPFFRFEDSLSRWMRSFHALGVRFRGATLTLDLLDRRGKYENGFMHGPEPAFFDAGRWRPARINFTANAVVGQRGAGRRATETLFHEGGHAAHFSNILADAPCFSQEFAPTSVAYAETQSMFMDSLLDDADWCARYARDEDGAPMPMDLIEETVREQQPFRGWDLRAMLTIPFAERALYELPDDQLVPDRVIPLFRDVERRLQGLSAGVRPVLAVPHLLAGESSAYYHGYVLAEMAVYQTRRFFLERDGRLTDNPRIGPDLAQAYWAPGNSVPFEETLRRLTGSGLSADALVESTDAGVDEAIAAARLSVSRLAPPGDEPGEVDLHALVRVVDGHEEVASTARGGYEKACEDFRTWIRELDRRA